MKRQIVRAFGVASFLFGLGLLFQHTVTADPLQGFQINRYEPTSPGEWGFLVDHPWFSATRNFGADITIDYANRPLVFGDTNRLPFRDATGPIAIEHQLMGRLGLAGSLFNRLQVSVSWPLTLLERGTEVFGINPISGVGLGDPRIGLMLRLAGNPYEDPISLSIGAVTYIPLRKWTDSIPEQVGDQEGRVNAKMVLSGVLYNQGSPHSVVWSVLGSFYYRKEAVIGNSPISIDNSTGSQFQVGFSLGYGNLEEHFHIGVEALLSADVLRGNEFKLGTMSLDLLLGTHIPLGRLFSFHVAGGVGLLQQSATADARVIAQLVFAPWKETHRPSLVSAPVISPLPQTKAVDAVSPTAPVTQAKPIDGNAAPVTQAEVPSPVSPDLKPTSSVK